MLIRFVFENGDKSTLSEVKWDAPVFDWTVLSAEFVIKFLNFDINKKHVESVH